MIYVDITADQRQEGKTFLALKLLREDRNACLLVGKGMKYRLRSIYRLSPNEMSRIVESLDDLRGLRVSVLIKDLT